MRYLLEIKRSAVLVVGLLISFSSVAGSIKGVPQRPSPQKLVNNLSTSNNFLSAEETQALEDKLEGFSNATSNQLVIVIVDSLNDYEPSEFATEIGHQWGVGQKKFDNGIIILVKLAAPRKVFVAVGYGLEGAIPDATAEEIVQNQILPEFRKGSYYLGLNKAVDILMGLAKGEYNSRDYDKSGAAGNKALGLIIALVIIIIVFVISRRGGGRGGYTIGNSGIFFWGGGFGGGGSSFGGGGGGGGFGGFGGGSFGGGGAGGSW